MLESGDQVDGRYVVDARIGVGGMAEVYRVKHVSLGSVHALKVLLLPHPGLRERFLREGRIQIRHPNVVAVTDVIEHRGKLGLLMEYVDHVSLQQLLEAQGALPLDQALTLFAYILSGMSAAHASGVLHRDIKPANILLANTAQGLVPKITDFGIAKVVMEGAAPGATRDGTMMGTPGYMAPEQVLNAADVDRRVDVFALGAQGAHPRSRRALRRLRRARRGAVWRPTRAAAPGDAHAGDSGRHPVRGAAHAAGQLAEHAGARPDPGRSTSHTGEAA